ncbi:AraC family transcriptional regulator [Croceicoccus ponticola]|uniref:AraC family transcriptional regulator n=2 Tax=Croceicoccus ponticola TaxID=2217664 RepID=A0A437H2J9_9SPHN|nr:AraC family transcriptional regulator [Croceicoccus ponticola]
MVTLIGHGPAPDCALPLHPVAFRFNGLTDERRPLLTYDRDFRPASANDTPLVLIAARAACDRLFSAHPDGGETWHLPSGLVMLALSILDCEGRGEARDTLRLARSIELLCQIHAALADGATLVATGSECDLSEGDVARVTAARRAIDQRWQDKITIAELARTTGLNRDKLARGFHGIYGATIAQVLSERRLSEARTMLLASDLPVATIAYRCSYLNNAAFTRAFNRRFGMAPSELRRTGIAG